MNIIYFVHTQNFCNCTVWSPSITCIYTVKPVHSCSYTYLHSVPMYAHWCTLTQTDVHSRELMYTNVHTRVHSCTPMYTHVDSSTMMYTNVHSRALKYTDVHSCALKYTDVHLMHTNVRPLNSCRLEYACILLNYAHISCLPMYRYNVHHVH